jgi:hypothetical protein
VISPVTFVSSVLSREKNDVFDQEIFQHPKTNRGISPQKPRPVQNSPQQILQINCRPTKKRPEAIMRSGRFRRTTLKATVRVPSGVGERLRCDQMFRSIPVQ